jgi:hypothetical protein
MCSKKSHKLQMHSHASFPGCGYVDEALFFQYVCTDLHTVAQIVKGF